jgi:hypothetical protein
MRADNALWSLRPTMSVACSISAVASNFGRCLSAYAPVMLSERLKMLGCLKSSRALRRTCAAPAGQMPIAGQSGGN